MADNPRVWLITGAGRGIGRALAEAALERGDRVVATVRDPDALGALEGPHSSSLQVLRLDVRDRDGAAEVAERAHDRFGRVDVLVNNAGYGLVGMVEELSEAEIREQVDTNLLGAIWMTQAVLPSMRSRNAGEIVQISTVGAVGTMPAFGLYNASKWGLEGFSEALASEVAGFGIGVTIAELGGFDTDWATTSMKFSRNLDAYNELRSAVFGTETLPWNLESQDEESAGSPPSVAAEALLAHLDSAERPLRLIVGDDAPDQIAAALALRRDDYGLDPRFTWPA